MCGKAPRRPMGAMVLPGEYARGPVTEESPARQVTRGGRCRDRRCAIHHARKDGRVQLAHRWTHETSAVIISIPIGHQAETRRCADLDQGQGLGEAREHRQQSRASNEETGISGPSSWG
jgi:hypothetical protein